MDLESNPILVQSDGAAIKEHHQKYYFELALFEVCADIEINTLLIELREYLG